MYSRKKAYADPSRSVPPYYSGVRFQSTQGGEIGDSGILPREQPSLSLVQSEDKAAEATHESSIFARLLEGVGSDELLILSFILLLVGEDGDNREAIVLLVLLLLD